MEKDFNKRHRKAVEELNKVLSEKSSKKTEVKLVVKKPIDKTKKKTKQKSSFLQPNLRSNILGLFFLLIGSVILILPFTLNYRLIFYTIVLNPDALNVKTGLGLILIGLFMILFINEKKPIDRTSSELNIKSNKFQLLMSEKITLMLSIWVVFLIFITYVTTLEVFFILIFIGTLVTKELTDYYTSPNLKFRLNVFVVIFLIIFTIIISQKIINIF